MRAIQLPNGNLLIPDESADPGEVPGTIEIGPDHPGYGAWLARTVPGEDPRPKKNREELVE
jgi:hypothetical protein